MNTVWGQKNLCAALGGVGMDALYAWSSTVHGHACGTWGLPRRLLPTCLPFTQVPERLKQIPSWASVMSKVDLTTQSRMNELAGFEELGEGSNAPDPERHLAAQSASVASPLGNHETKSLKRGSNSKLGSMSLPPLGAVAEDPRLTPRLYSKRNG